MSEKVTFNKTSYNKSQFGEVVNTQFTQLTPASTASLAQTIDVNQFFEAYNNLFFQIPKLGDNKSHQYLVNKSSEYIGEEAISEEVQALLEEITQLRQENLELQQQVINVTVQSINPVEESNGDLNQKGTARMAPKPVSTFNISDQGTAISGRVDTSGGGPSRTIDPTTGRTILAKQTQ